MMFAFVKVLGHVFSLKLILYGTKEDPLTNNSHVDRSEKKVMEFTEAQIENRKRGQSTYVKTKLMH